MYAEFSQKTKSKQNKRYNLFFCMYLNLVCCSHFRIVLPWPQLSVCMRLDKNRSRSSMSAYMQKQSNHNFELIDKASPEASTRFLSLSLYLSVYQLKSVHFIVWHFKWMQILLHILVCEPYTHIVCLTIFRGKIFDFLCYTEFHI